MQSLSLLAQRVLLTTVLLVVLSPSAAHAGDVLQVLGWNTCVRSAATSAVKCFGTNARGILGQNMPVPISSGDVGDAPDELGHIPPLDFAAISEDADIVSLGGSTNAACALFDNGRLLCWGNGAGTGSEGASAQQVSTLDFLTFSDDSPATYIASSVGEHSNCAVFASGGVRCWGIDALGNHGQNAQGQTIGDEPGEMGTLEYIPFNTAASAIKVSILGNGHLTLFDDGTVFALGHYATHTGECGYQNACGTHPGEVEGATAIDFGTELAAVDIAGGTYSGGCVVFEGRLLVKCFGEKVFLPKMVDGTTAYLIHTDTVKDLPFITFREPSVQVTALTIGISGVGFVFANGKAQMMGSAFMHDGDTDTNVADAATLPYLPFSENAIEISTQYYHACAAFDTGYTRCWGQSSFGANGGGGVNVGDVAGELVGLEPVFQAVCGDGITEFAEECDDDEFADGDGCSSECEVERGYICSGTPSICVHQCENGLVQPEVGEQCDDGNNVADDGCTLCIVDEGMLCNGEPSVCGPFCDFGGRRVADDVTFASLTVGSGVQLNKDTDVENGCSIAGAIAYGSASKELFVCTGSNWQPLASSEL